MLMYEDASATRVFEVLRGMTEEYRRMGRSEDSLPCSRLGSLCDINEGNSSLNPPNFDQETRDFIDGAWSTVAGNLAGL